MGFNYRCNKIVVVQEGGAQSGDKNFKNIGQLKCYVKTISRKIRVISTMKFFVDVQNNFRLERIISSAETSYRKVIIR